jgi:hypothetical protein
MPIKPRPVSDDALPPEKVHLEELRVEPYSDGRRVKVYLTLSPFTQPPNIEVILMNAAGEQVSSVSIIESTEEQLVFTVHIRSQQTTGQYSLSAAVVYPEIGVVNNQIAKFEIEA